MDLLFLGTSSGTPTRARNVSGLALIEDTGKGWYLIDCGEATQHQLLRTPLSLHKLNAIFITHVHGDHCYGLPGLLASAGMSGRTRALDIIAPKGIEEWITATLRLTQTHLPFALHFHATETLAQWGNGAVIVQATTLSHRVLSFGYTFTEARPDPKLDTARLDRDAIPRGPLWGKLARGFEVEHEGRVLCSEDYLLCTREPRRLVIGGDNDRPELLTKACRDAQVLVHEATYTQAVAGNARQHHGHSTAGSVAQFAQAAGVPNLVLTHFSARYQADSGRSPSIVEVQAEAAEHYQGALYLAEDFMRLHLSRDGVLRQI